MNQDATQRIEAMTVNERLDHFGLMDQFDAAIRARNEGLATAILQQAMLSNDQAKFTVQTTLANPKRYGY